MAKVLIKRCVRPQCMTVYDKDDKRNYCCCGAILEFVDIVPEKREDALPSSIEKTTSDGSGNDENIIKADGPIGTDDSFDSQTSDNEIGDNMKNETKAYLYLLLDNINEVEYKLADKTIIGRSTEENQVDVDLSEYFSEGVSKMHASIDRRDDGFYLTNISSNHSVRIIDQNENEYALEKGESVLLRSEDGILLSRKIILQFVEE